MSEAYIPRRWRGSGARRRGRRRSAAARTPAPHTAAWPGRRHGRAHAEGARFVARRSHRTSLGAVADCDGASPQHRIVALLDRRIEGVHVNVDDLAQRHDVTITELERKETPDCSVFAEPAGTGTYPCTSMSSAFLAGDRIVCCRRRKPGGFNELVPPIR